MIYDNKSGVSDFLSAPVELNTKKIYPIDNYGSSMAPFYSTLSIWIGGIVLVAMLKVTVSEESIKKMGLKNVKIHEIYLGRWIIFLILGLLQSTLIARRCQFLKSVHFIKCSADPALRPYPHGNM